MALKPFGEWAPDASNLADALATVKNCYPREDHYAPLYGASPISPALPAAPVAGISTAVIGGISEIYAATLSKLYQLVGGTTWTDRSGSVYLTEPPGVWAFGQYKDRVLVVSINNLMQQKQIAAVGNFASVTDSPKGRVIGAVKQFVMVGDINDPTDGYVPYRVRWNAINNPLSWPLPGTNAAAAVQADQQDLRAESGAVTGIFGTTVGIILQKNSVTRAEYVGSPLVFSFTEIDSSRGMAYRNAGAVAGRFVYYLSESGFYKTDGSGESVPIGAGKVDRWFFANLNSASTSNVVCSHLPQYKLISWAFPSGDSSTNDMVLLYAYELDKWAYAEINTAVAFFGRTTGYTLDQLDAFGTLETLSASLDSSVWEGGLSLPMFFTPDWRLASLDGTVLNATIETHDVTWDGRRFFLSGVRPLVGTQPTTLTVNAAASSGNIGMASNWTGARNRTPATGQVDFRLSGHIHRLRFDLTGEFDKFTGYDAVGAFDDGAR